MDWLNPDRLTECISKTLADWIRLATHSTFGSGPTAWVPNFIDSSMFSGDGLHLNKKPWCKNRLAGIFPWQTSNLEQVRSEPFWA